MDISFKVIVLSLILLTSCAQSDQTRKQKDKPATPPTFSGTQGSERKIIKKLEEHERVDADIFGDFHNDRLRLFTKHEPDLDFQGASVESVVFYYVDEDLFQKRYALDNDISTDLIKEHGKFKIRGLNARNVNLIKENRTNIFVDNQINPELDFYQIRWELPENEIIYQVRRDTIEHTYNYVERVRNYRYLMKEIERSAS
ncbi:MAG: hypothetical protein RJQ09_00200 [Cyclobacteriaceae bacterium]